MCCAMTVNVGSGLIRAPVSLWFILSLMPVLQVPRAFDPCHRAAAGSPAVPVAAVKSFGDRGV